MFLSRAVSTLFYLHCQSYSPSSPVLVFSRLSINKFNIAKYGYAAWCRGTSLNCFYPEFIQWNSDDGGRNISGIFRANHFAASHLCLAVEAFLIDSSIFASVHPSENSSAWCIHCWHLISLVSRSIRNEIGWLMAMSAWKENRVNIWMAEVPVRW